MQKTPCKLGRVHGCVVQVREKLGKNVWVGGEEQPTEEQPDCESSGTAGPGIAPIHSVLL